MQKKEKISEVLFFIWRKIKNPLFWDKNYIVLDKIK